MPKYISCSLDYENFAHPDFNFYDDYKEALVDNVRHYAFDPDDSASIEIEKNRITLNRGEEFYVTEIFELDPSWKWLVVWHHAYDGVGFIVDGCETLDAALTKMYGDVEYEKQNFYDRVTDLTEEDDPLTVTIDVGSEWHTWNVLAVVAAPES